MRHLNHDHEGDTAMIHHDQHNHAVAARDISDSFSRDTSGLPSATSPETVNLRDGNVFDLCSRPVRKRTGGTEVRMLGYNGSIPGPTLHVDQGSEITVRATNDGDVETTVHWHGLRLERTVTTRYRKRRKRQSRSEARSPTNSSSPMPGSIGTIRTSGKTSLRRWGCTLPSWSSPPAHRTGLAWTGS